MSKLVNDIIELLIDVFGLYVHYIFEELIKSFKIINLINMIGRTNKDHVTIKDVPAEAFIKAFAE